MLPVSASPEAEAFRQRMRLFVAERIDDELAT
jgi:hypothetical protein